MSTSYPLKTGYTYLATHRLAMHHCLIAVMELFGNAPTAMPLQVIALPNNPMTAIRQCNGALRVDQFSLPPPPCQQKLYLEQIYQMSEEVPEHTYYNIISLDHI